MNLEEEVKHCEEVHRPSREATLNLLKGKGFKIGVEIGVQYGQNAEMWLENNVVEKLYGIDPFNSGIGRISPLNGQDEEIFRHTMKRLERFGDRFQLIRKSSNEAIYDVPGEIDCIYIDGNNSKRAAIDDISYWYPKVRKGGIVIGHNYDHSSFPFVKDIVKDYFGVAPYTDKGYTWWMNRTGDFTYPLKKVSVVTPFYNAHEYIGQYRENLDDERISEIIMVDDGSDIPLDNYLGNKIKVLKNDENMGEFKTRIKGAEAASNDWVIFLDNDNSLTKDYLDNIFSIPKWREDVIYHPDFGNKHHINYRSIKGNYIGLPNIGKFMREQRYLMSMFLNTGNYFMNRNRYLGTAKPVSDIDKHAYGDIWFNYHWMKSGKSMFVVPDMEYVHRRRKDSAWKVHQKTMQPVTDKILKELWNL